jgi:cellulose synthase/poly-beta-1,6-N-acetylglucosamine synthase-like glycosyltransferase
VDDSLSIIVPVRDVQASIWDQVHYLLDLLPDLTSRFEIIVVDDASRDHTAEIAGDLAREYPQVKLLVHSDQRGLAHAAKTGLAAANGQIILVQEDMATVSANDLRRLWSLRHDRDVVMARSQQKPGTLSPDVIDRLSTWGQSLRNLRKRTSPGGIQMIRRDGAQSFTLRNSSAHETTPQRETNTGKR